jgi:hypothetical protein
VISVWLDVPQRVLPRAQYVLAELSCRWGIPLVAATDPAWADLLYVAEQVRAYPGLLIHCDVAAYEDVEAAFSVRDSPFGSAWLRDLELSDPLAGIFRLLTLMDERSVPRRGRDERGNLSVDALPPARRNARDIPLVEQQAQGVLQALNAHREQRWLRRSLWPEGVLVVSHDTDAVTTRTLREVATNFAKVGLRADRHALAAAFIGMRPHHIEDDPLFGFTAWADIERAQDIRSTFFLFARPRGIPHRKNDCRSSVLSRNFPWRILQNLAEQGWNFGLHAPLGAQTSVDGFERAREAIEDRLDGSLVGVRNHYWAIDWQKPWETARAQALAGFTYDSSIAWRDSAGFRSGTCLPYEIFDEERNAPAGLIELPVGVMDGHPPDLVHSTMARAAAAQGMIVANWHTESGRERFRFRGSVADLEDILLIARSTSAKVATAEQVVSAWRRWGAELGASQWASSSA